MTCGQKQVLYNKSDLMFSLRKESWLSVIIHLIIQLKALFLPHLSNISESTAALSTHPMSGTPASILMFFSGIPLLPPRAKIKAAM